MFTSLSGYYYVTEIAKQPWSKHSCQWKLLKWGEPRCKIIHLSMRLLFSMEDWTQKKIAEFVLSEYLGILAIQKREQLLKCEQWQRKRKMMHCFGCGLSTCQCKNCSAKIVDHHSRSKWDGEKQWKGKWYSSTQSIAIIYQCTWKQEISKTNIATYFNARILDQPHFCWFHCHKFFAFAKKKTLRSQELSEQMSHTHSSFIGIKDHCKSNCDEQNADNGKIPKQKKIKWFEKRKRTEKKNHLTFLIRLSWWA